MHKNKGDLNANIKGLMEGLTKLHFRFLQHYTTRELVLQIRTYTKEITWLENVKKE